jgi:hypothetical protein
MVAMGKELEQGERACDVVKVWVLTETVTKLIPDVPGSVTLTPCQPAAIPWAVVILIVLSSQLRAAMLSVGQETNKAVPENGRS